MTTSEAVDRALVKALGHPLRLRILEVIIVRGEESPVRLARELGQPLPTVSRHVRLLRDLGFLEMTRTVPRRGAVEHFYKAVELAFIDEREWEQLPVPLRRGLAGQTFRRVFAEASASGGSGGFDAPESHLDRVTLQLDERGRSELSQLLNKVLRHADAIQRRSDARIAANGSTGPVEESTLALLHFRSHFDSRPPERASREGVSERPTFR